MYKQITLNVDRQSITVLEELFFEFGALATTISDNNEGNEFEEMIFDEPVGLTIGQENCKVWDHSKLTVLFMEDADINLVFEKIYNTKGIHIDYQLEYIQDQDWVSLSQKQHDLIFISDNFVVASEWHTIPANCKGIILNAGLAFGSGTHPTTRMCMDWLVNHHIRDKTILDFGCGSGILAITASILGAKQVVGIDIDPQAIDSSKGNALLNKINNADFFHNEHLDSFSIKQFEVVIANILANPLIELAEIIASYCSNYLILSGVLEMQVPEVIQAYSRMFDSCEVRSIDGWAAIYLTKAKLSHLHS